MWERGVDLPPRQRPTVPRVDGATARLTVGELARAAGMTAKALRHYDQLGLFRPDGVDEGNGGQPQLRHNLTLDASSGAVAAWAPFSSQTTGQKARSWIRFLHTGEALGLIGQTIAGLVSFTSILMVWTGLALAYRRLVQPLLRRKPATAAPEAA